MTGGSTDNFELTQDELLLLGARNLNSCVSPEGSFWEQADQRYYKDLALHVVERFRNSPGLRTDEVCISPSGDSLLVGSRVTAGSKWLSKATQMGELVPPAEFIAEQFKWIDDLVRENRWVELTKFFETLSCKELNTTSLLAFLRGTFLVRSKLPIWIEFRDKVAQTLTARSLNTNSLMKGLYQ